jgi:hypothetical protein
MSEVKITYEIWLDDRKIADSETRLEADEIEAPGTWERIGYQLSYYVRAAVAVAIRPKLVEGDNAKLG